MLPLLLVAALLSGSPAKKAPKSAPAPAFTSGLQLVVPERMLEDFLAAALPVSRTVTRDVALLGLRQKVDLKVTLKNPRVKVTPASIDVTLDFDLVGPGGVATSGVVTPRFVLRVLDERGLVEGRLSGASLGTSGVELPVDELVEPIAFASGTVAPVEAAGVKVRCEGVAQRVTLEQGRVRITGGWRFSKLAGSPR